MNAKAQVEACLENEVAIFNEGSRNDGAGLISTASYFSRTGYCSPNNSDGNLCQVEGNLLAVTDITACDGASNGSVDNNKWYLPSSCNQECAQQRCDNEPLCTVRSCFSSYVRHSLLFFLSLQLCTYDLLSIYFYYQGITWDPDVNRAKLKSGPLTVEEDPQFGGECYQKISSAPYFSVTGYCSGENSDGNLCQFSTGDPDNVVQIAACDGASSETDDQINPWYLPSSCNQECAQQRCDNEPLCTVRSCFSYV